MIKVTCAIIINGNKFLITQKQENSEHPLMWEFPGGKMNEDENPEECIQREIQEELEIEVEILERMKSVQFDYGFKKIELIPFLCVTKSFHLKLNEHIQAKWVNLFEIEHITLLGADKKLIRLQENYKILEKHLGKQVDKS